MEPNGENPRASRRKYWILFTTLLLLAIALILPPLINLNRYQRRIAEAIGNSLGRPVHLSSVTLRLLPRPGLELSDFLVEEDPAFGSEPTLRAQSVDASIRLTSLWRGRLEIGRISFDQPSLNLVSNHDGRWNIGSVLLQASHIPNAPTAQRHAGGSPRFPYIEASNARVNFKIGIEKKPFALLNADFAMWLAEPDEWRIRLEAQPVRTDIDLGLSDTGLLKVEGSLHRASAIDSMPMDLETEWSNAPMGQIARLLIGQDTGWRGSLDVTGVIKGDLFNPQFKTHIRVGGLHRQEFSPLDTFNVDATCKAGYRHDSHSLNDLTCLWPIDDGHLLLTGNIPILERPKPALNLRIQNVPAAFGLSALQLVRKGFASSTHVSGTLQGNLTYASVPNESLTGEATISGLKIQMPGMDSPLALPALHLAGLPVQTPRRRAARTADPISLHLLNASVPLGGDAPLLLSGDFTGQTFALHLAGGASIARLRPLIANTGLLHNAGAGLGPQGTATLDLTVSGPWSLPTLTAENPNPAPSAATQGTLHLKNATYQAYFLPEPVEIIAAQATLTPSQIVWNPVSVSFHRMPATLSVTIPVTCREAPCADEFSLATPQLDATALQSALMGAGEHGEFLQQILARLDRNRVEWPALTGLIRTGTFTLGPLTFHDASTTVHIEGRRIQFRSIEAHALNGVLQATGAMNAADGAPHYTFDLDLLHANTAALANVWHDPSLAGIVSATAHLELSGYSADDLAQSATGKFHWDWTQGTTPLAPAALARFDHWSADGTIKDKQLQFDHSRVTTGPQAQSVSGSISFDRKPDLTVTNEAEQPHVVRADRRTP